MTLEEALARIESLEGTLMDIMLTCERQCSRHCGCYQEIEELVSDGLKQ